MTDLLERVGLPLLHCLDPERAHGLALQALKFGLASGPGPISSPRLATRIAGLDLPNPVGLAAGFDKNAEAVAPLLKTGFGFIEIGAVTPWPQPGNPRPRLFRLTEDQAAINRFGFNNQGMEAVSARLAKRPRSGIVGINLGANKDSTDRAADFSTVLKHCGALVDFATVNVSSPNTERLRDLQGRDALSALLVGVMEANATLKKPLPIFLKIAPDLNDGDLDDIASVARAAKLSGIIATNTTLNRSGLRSHHATEIGGLSGQPLFEPSTRVLAKLFLRLGRHIPLIGVGGISNGEQAYAKLRAGASAVQFYTALVYGGISLAAKIAHDLDRLLARDGLSVADATGLDAADWAIRAKD